MIRDAIFYACAVLLVHLFFVPRLQAQQHEREYWRGIVQHKYSIPENESADALARELSTQLGSPDPELRDDLAYSILGTWIHRNLLSQNALLALADEWRANLTSGIGERGTNSVLKRSFSALCLSEAAKREAKAAFMGSQRYHSLVSDAIAYLQAERDLRGYDADLHWIHATAHTSDLLAALADNPMLTREEAASILRAISARLSTAPEVYTQGEQDRLAAAVVSVIRRKDFEVAEFEPWLAALQNEDRDVWTKTSVASLARYQNHNYLLQALTVRLSLEPASAKSEQCRTEVLKVLADR